MKKGDENTAPLRDVRSNTLPDIRYVPVQKRVLQIKRTCEQCGKPFIAATTTTRFCSKACYNHHYYRTRKKEIEANYRRLNEAQGHRDMLKSLACDGDLLTVKRFANKLGVSSQTVRNMAAREQVRIIKFTRRLTYISWSEFTNTHVDLPCKGDISEAALVKTATETAPEKEEYQVENIKEQPHVIPDTGEGMKQWIDLNEGCRRYSLKPNSFQSFVSTKKIPKRKVDGKIMYYQPYIDRARGQNIPKDYISVADAEKKYSLYANVIAAKLAHYNIETLKMGKQVYFPESDFQRIINSNAQDNPPQIVHEPVSSTETSAYAWLGAEAASVRYGLNVESFVAYANKMRISKKVVNRKVMYSILELDEKRGFNIIIPPGFISTDAAREKYNLSMSNIYGKLTKYHIRKIKKGKKVYFPEQDFIEVINRHTEA